MFLISDLCSMLEKYLEPEQVSEVYEAYLFGAQAHEGQKRLSGEPYIYHPLAVARILAGMGLDHQTIIAAILHDVIEDTPTAKDQLTERFGEEVAELVDGVSKLTHIQFENKAQAHAENFRKMMLAMVQDIRVILIKLADRLHNMHTLGVMRHDKKRRIAKETLEIYVPIANRLGLNAIRTELQELGFEAYYPMRHRVLKAALERSRGHRKEVVQKLLNAFQERLRQEDLVGEVHGREKRLYSIYNKMREKQLSFNDVIDVYGFRIIVDSVDTCYRVLGAIHNTYKPIPGRFKDYIAIPKANGYQSLHTALQTPYGFPIEVQIRTEDMEKVAEAGIASHWMYKNNEAKGSITHSRAREWLRNLLEMQQSAGDSLEFLENVKVDLFPDEVYVFTPKGEILVLPRGATAVDFAYAVHTGVGNRCVAVRIDQQLRPLHSTLFNGQHIEVLTSKNATPSPTWLNFVTTGKARANIRNFLKNLQMDESVQLGKRLLNKSLQSLSSSLDAISEQKLDEVAHDLGLESALQLFTDIGLGNRIAPILARRLVEENGGERVEEESRTPSTPLFIKGSEGAVVSYAKCCRPIPGDAILGLITSGKGIVIHRIQCKNVSEFRKYPDKWIEVEWEQGIEAEFMVDIRVEVTNQRGVLASVAATISESMANIDNITIEEHDGLHSAIDMTISTHNRVHLARVMRRLKAMDKVLRIYRR